MPLLDVGDTFAGDFEVEAHLASGEFAETYRARQRSLARRVALKVLRGGDQGAVADEQVAEWRARFEREAKVASEVDSDRVVTVYEVGRDQGHSYIALEFIEGRDVRELIDSEGAISVAETVGILKQVLEGLRDVHETGALHRDVKPGNIMLHHDGEWEATLVDFGLVRPGRITHDDRTLEDVTEESEIVGTPRYMAPEQIKSEAVGPASDIYSLGLVAWEMLLGRRAIQKRDTLAVLSAQIDDEPFEWPEDADVPQQMRLIVDRMIQRYPEDRYDSAQAVLDDLEDLESGTAGAITETATGAESTERGAENEAEAATAADASTASAVVRMVSEWANMKRERGESGSGASPWWFAAAGILIGGGLLAFVYGGIEFSPGSWTTSTSSTTRETVADENFVEAAEAESSIDGIVRALETRGWEAKGAQGRVETQTGQRIVREFVRDGDRVTVVFHKAGEESVAEQTVESAEEPARGVRFERLAVVVRPVEGDADAADELFRLLRQYRVLLAEQHEN